ncbi:MAG: pantetheine-phosphate adenylyltransferase [Clostridia bacterium]|nr:pantetheine-phosphate adenylyltransferase [Clostridia bacterium]
MDIMDQKIAIVPGSFDPITLGHLDIIERAAALYDLVYVAVMVNSEKSYMFSMEQRKRIAEAAVGNCPNVKVISSEGMLWKLAKELGAVAIVKGVRNDVDLAYEQTMAKYNSAHYSAAETVLLPAKEEYLHLSSTLVRTKILAREDLSACLPKGAICEIQKVFPTTL